nr:probable serine/threonine-protein kinase clkA isoform X4 [Misgurnus anguillicaudatus]
MVMDALFHLFSMRQPDVLAINTHTLTDILEGKPRARSRYFTKRNIFENIKEIIGPYLECGNHWTFFHCSIVDHTITYLNSLGEEDEQYYKLAENWSIFAASKGYRGPWKRTKRNHTLQNDTISCGVFTAVFAEAFLGDTRGYLACSPVLQERERLGIFLFSSLDRSGICGICHRMASRKIQEKCSTCSVRIHTKCLPGNQEDARCIFCKDSAGEIIPNRTRIEGQDSSGQSNPKNTRPEEQHSLGESNTNSRHEGQDSSGVSNPNTKNEGQDTTGERNSNTRNEGQDSTGESNSNTRNEGQDSTGESNPNTRNEGQDSKGESNPNTRNEGQDSTGESNPNTRNDGQDSTGERNPNTRNEGQDSTGESNPNTRNEGQDSTGESNPNTRNDGQDSTGESNPNTRNERQDSTGESNSNTRNEGQDSTGESNPNTRNERQDTTGESNPNTRNEGQDSTEESNPNTRNEGQHSTGESFPNTTGLEEQDSIRQSAGVEGKNSTGQIQDKSGGFLVESVLKVSDFNQAKRYLVTSEELQRRCSLPECYSANTVVAYLRKAKGQKQKITEKLVELEVTPSKRTKLTSQCSKLCEDECSDLAGDLTYLAAKFIPQKKVAQALLEEGNLHTAMAKTEECRKTLKAVQNALESNWETYDLATHGLGPAVIKGTFSLIDSCLKEKMRALKSKDSTDK